MKFSALARPFGVTALSLGLSLAAAPVIADTYQVTVTNVTANQAFTPRLAITHIDGRVFSLGGTAIDELVDIAEGGDLAPMMALLGTVGEAVTDMQVGDGLLEAGASQTMMIEGNPGSYFSLFNMLIPTNDAFIGVNGIMLPASGSVTSRAVAYDAGSETNDELCANIPGPVCGGAPGSPDDEGEGFIHVHRGIHGVGDLDAAVYDWRNPAAIVTVTKM